MKTAVVYARYSCDNQTEQSIEGQLRVCQEFAKNNQILIVDTYIDRAMTGTNDNRPDFKRMLHDSNKRQWDYVIVYKLDRFSRNKYESVIHKRTLKENGIKVLSAMENIPDTPEGIILESLLEGMNQYYSAELSQKVKRGMRETRLKGYFQGGTLLYGYKLDGRKIIINEEQAEIVRYIFEQYKIGIYAKDIVNQLNAKGILFRGKVFTDGIVYKILQNEKYSGKYYHNDELVENMYPRIISDDLYKKVRAILDKNKKGSKSVKVNYLLKGKVKCGLCGLPINGECGTTRFGKTFYYYKCSGRKKRINNCAKHSIQKDILEKFILDKVIEKMREPLIMDVVVKSLLDMQNKFVNNNSELTIMEKQKKQLENTLKNIMSAIEQGVVTKTTATRLKELENQIESLEKKILVEKCKTNIKIPENTIREYYSKVLEHQSLMLINTLIKVIVLYDDKIEITFNKPMPKSPDDNQGFLFYTETSQILHSYQNRDNMVDILVRFYL